MTYTKIKILDKISSKNVSLELINGENFKYNDLQIKSIKCKHSEFDDDPEIIAYVQVKDLRNKKNDEVYEGDHNNNNNGIGINVDVDKYCIWSVEENQHADQSTKRPSTHEGEFLTDNAYWMCFIGCRARKD